VLFGLAPGTSAIALLPGTFAGVVAGVEEASP
jgi:hypothetical protein